MRSHVREFVLLCALTVLLVPARAQADTVKVSLFIFGIHVGGAESVAVEHNGQPTDTKPGAMTLIKRNLRWSIDVAETMKWPADKLTKLLKEVDQLSFADMQKRLESQRLEYQAYFAKEINPGAAAFFILGIHQNGAENVALRHSDAPRRLRPGAGALLERNANWMKDGASAVKVSVAPVDEFKKDLANDVGFADLASQLEKIRLLWQKELADQPAFAAAGAGGPALVSVNGQLTNNDPMDRVRTKSHAKIHTVKLQAGASYVIDLGSGPGAPPFPAGSFDTYLRLEDAAGTQLAENDDINTGKKEYNSRLVFQAPQSGDYRVVVTTFEPGATGAYTLTVRPK